MVEFFHQTLKKVDQLMIEYEYSSIYVRNIIVIHHISKTKDKNNKFLINAEEILEIIKIYGFIYLLIKISIQMILPKMGRLAYINIIKAINVTTNLILVVKN